jgi:hypothetical protein
MVMHTLPGQTEVIITKKPVKIKQKSADHHIGRPARKTQVSESVTDIEGYSAFKCKVPCIKVESLGKYSR